MATSPNYGWSEPDNTSLVKDGAQAMRTLGDAIDTSVWNVGFGQAGKNKIINGDFGIWQRGTSFAAPNYSADRWYTIGGSTTYSRETTAANLPTGFRYGMKMLMSATNVPLIAQAIETSNSLPYAGKRVILSYYVSSTAASDCLIRLDYSTNVDNSISGTWTTLSAATGYSATASTTSTMTRVSCAYDVPSNAQSLRVLIGSNVNITNTNSMTITGVQLEAGSIATPFQTASGGSIQGELAMCQRYYFDSRDGSNQPFSGYTNSTDYLLANVRYPVTMRTTPSVTIGQSSGSNYVRRISTGGQLAITVTLYPGTNSGGFSGVYCAAAPFAAAVGYDFYILASAEL